MSDNEARVPLADLDQVRGNMSMDGFGYGQSLGIEIVEVGWGLCKAKLEVRPEMLRPGGTIAGPVMMGLADAAMWGVAMTVHDDGVQSVTSDLTIHFLKRPAGQVLHCTAQVVKPGRRLMVFRADLTVDADPAVVAACQSSYAVPPVRIVKD